MTSYRFDKSYEWNYANGPLLSGVEAAVPATPIKDFLGIPVASRFGIAAGILLNARWVAAYARLGYDILTYKTVRSRARACYALPNWVYVEPGALDFAADPAAVRARAVPADGARPESGVASSVSFGTPSKAPAEWMPDVARARAAIGPGQALVVSITATPEDGDMVADFANLAAMAREAGAQAVEANLSCPNVTTAEGQIFRDAELSGRVAMAMRGAAGGLPVAVKPGYLPDDRALRAFLRAVDGAADAVLMGNGIPRRVVDAAGAPVFGPGREVSGICGPDLHAACVAELRRGARLAAEDGLGLRLIGIGGVHSAATTGAYFDAGAAAVMMGSAPAFDPGLGARLKAEHPDW